MTVCFCFDIARVDFYTDPMPCQNFVKTEPVFGGVETQETLDLEWCIRQDLNLQPSDPKTVFYIRLLFTQNFGRGKEP